MIHHHTPQNTLPSKRSLPHSPINQSQREKRESGQSEESRKMMHRKRELPRNQVQSSLGLESRHEQDNLQFSDYCFEGGVSVKQRNLENLMELEEQNKSGRVENRMQESEEYGIREIEILSRKRVSNYRYLITQLKQLIKVKKLEILVSEKKEIRTRIIKLENDCRKLKLANRKWVNSRNIKFSQKSKYLKKLKQHQSEKGRSLHKNLFQSEEFLKDKNEMARVYSSSYFSRWTNYEEEKKKILLIRLEMLKKAVKSSRNYIKQKQAYLKFENDILKNEIQLIQSEVNRNTQIMKSESIRFSQLQRASQQSEHVNTKRSEDQLFYSPKIQKHQQIYRKMVQNNEEKVFKRKWAYSPLEPLQKIVSH